MNAAPTVVTEAAVPTAVWDDWSCLVRLVVSDEAALKPATETVRSLMRRVESAASRFRIDSELNWANANTGRPVAVSRTFASLVDAALGEARRSAGSLDPTIGGDLIRLGYDRDIALVAGTSIDAPDDPLAELSRNRRPDWRDIRLDRFAGLLMVPPGCALDLGASAKAMTVDWAAEQIHQRFGCDVLVEIGGDLAVAGAQRDWQIHVAERAGQPGQQVSLSSGGLATSTTTIRRWQIGDLPAHHIIDPASGRPAAGPWRTVTVAAGSALHANTCSTSAIVLGDEALGWLADQRVAARLVDQGGEIVTVGGWPC